jgi:transcriptional regulator with XRE-family HTH domain
MSDESQGFKEITDRLGMRPEAVAVALGISVGTYNNYRSGRVKRMAASVVDAARALAADAGKAG